MSTAPYDFVYTVLNAVRTRIGDDLDSLLPLGGQIASNSQSYSQQCLNTAWRRLQQFLVLKRFSRMIVSNFILASVPAVNSEDAALEVSLSWSGYNDGFTDNPGFVLPQDLIQPLKLSERPSDTAPNINAFIDMDGPEQGIVRLPSIPKQQWNGIWVWNDDQIMMPGALVLTDIRVTYAAYLADFLDTGDVTSAVDFTPWFEQKVPILRALEPLASYTLAELERGRGNADAAAAYTADAERQAMAAIIRAEPGAVQ